MRTLRFLTQPQPETSILGEVSALTESLFTKAEKIYPCADGEIFFNFDNFIVRCGGAFSSID